MTQDDIDYLGPLLTDPSRIKREAVRRRKPFDEKSVSPDDIPDHEAKGWQVDRKLKRKTKVSAKRKLTSGSKTDSGCFSSSWVIPNSATVDPSRS